MVRRRLLYTPRHSLTWSPTNEPQVLNLAYTRISPTDCDMIAVLLRTTPAITGLNLSFTKISASSFTTIMSAAIYLDVLDLTFTR